MLSSDQIRGARAILRLGQAELAKAADVSLETIKRIELDGGRIENQARYANKIQNSARKGRRRVYRGKWRRRWRPFAQSEALALDCDNPREQIGR